MSSKFDAKDEGGGGGCSIYRVWLWWEVDHPLFAPLVHFPHLFHFFPFMVSWLYNFISFVYDFKGSRGARMRNVQADCVKVGVVAVPFSCCGETISHFRSFAAPHRLECQRKCQNNPGNSSLHLAAMKGYPACVEVGGSHSFLFLPRYITHFTDNPFVRC